MENEIFSFNAIKSNHPKTCSLFWRFRSKKKLTLTSIFPIDRYIRYVKQSICQLLKFVNLKNVSLNNSFIFNLIAKYFDWNSIHIWRECAIQFDIIITYFDGMRLFIAPRIQSVWIYEKPVQWCMSHDFIHLRNGIHASKHRCCDSNVVKYKQKV